MLRHYSGSTLDPVGCRRLYPDQPFLRQAFSPLSFGSGCVKLGFNHFSSVVFQLFRHWGILFQFLQKPPWDSDVAHLSAALVVHLTSQVKALLAAY